MAALPDHLLLKNRLCLPDEQRFLLAEHPRATWDENARTAGAAAAWLHFHEGFRQGAAIMVGQVDALRRADTPTRAFAAEFGHTAGSFLAGLEGHHGIEDNHYFPMFMKAEPRLQHGFEILDGDHHAIHNAIDDFANATVRILRAIKDGGETLSDEGKFATDALETQLTTFRRHLLRHLDDEEEIVVPLMIALSQKGAAGA